MPLVPESLIKHCMESRSLVSLTRDEFDKESHRGFILDYDSQWILLQSIHDFLLDGYVIFRRSDLTSMNCSETTQIHEEFLKADGLLQQINFQFKFPLGGLAEFLANLPKERIVILENESEEELFLIGPILSVEDERISLRFFSGTGEFDEEPSEADLGDITSASFSTSYTQAYERHFKRLSSSPPSSG